LKLAASVIAEKQSDGDASGPSIPGPQLPKEKCCGRGNGIGAAPIESVEKEVNAEIIVRNPLQVVRRAIEASKLNVTLKGTEKNVDCPL
jgi:hypothetical protein